MTSKARKQRAGGEVKRLSVLQQDDLLATMASYTRLGHFSLHYLTGDRNAKARVEILSTALGRKVTQKQAGINAMREALRVALDVEKGCMAEVESEIDRQVREWVADQEKASTMTAEDILAVWRKL